MIIAGDDDADIRLLKPIFYFLRRLTRRPGSR